MPENLQLDETSALSILIKFLQQEVRKVGFQRVILGLSGGIDSALVAGLAAKAFGPRQVFGILMPYQASNPDSLEDAKLVAWKFKIQTKVIPITPQVQPYFDSQKDMSHLRRGNKMARERMSILYDQSVALNGLVLGTSNKTELLLGYGTLHGDMASAINPLGDLYKTQVRQLARAIGVPSRVVEKAPSADLWQGQTDEAELGFSYEKVDQLLYWLVDRRASDQTICRKGFEPEFLKKIKQKVIASQYKRRLPVIAKLSERTIDRDFRYPRDWNQ